MDTEVPTVTYHSYRRDWPRFWRCRTCHQGEYGHEALEKRIVGEMKALRRMAEPDPLHDWEQELPAWPFCKTCHERWPQHYLNFVRHKRELFLHGPEKELTPAERKMFESIRPHTYDARRIGVMHDCGWCELSYDQHNGVQALLDAEWQSARSGYLRFDVAPTWTAPTSGTAVKPQVTVYPTVISAVTPVGRLVVYDDRPHEYAEGTVTVDNPSNWIRGHAPFCYVCKLSPEDHAARQEIIEASLAREFDQACGHTALRDGCRSCYGEVLAQQRGRRYAIDDVETAEW